MVLAREFSISDSANPFYLKLRNSIPPVPHLTSDPTHDNRLPSPCMWRHEGIHPRDFSTPLGIPLPPSPPASYLGCPFFVLRGGAKGGDGRFYIFQRAVAAAALLRRYPGVTRYRDIGQQKLKSSVYLSCTRASKITAARLSREIARRGNTPEPREYGITNRELFFVFP